MNLDTALSNIREIVPQETRLEYNQKLSEKYGVPVYLKFENEGPIGSYKWRGAGNAIASLLNEGKEKGVICASAGNHAQGVALAAKKFQIPSTIVMPKTAPKTKVDKTSDIGGDYAEVILHGDNFDEAFAHAQQLLSEKGQTFIHPFDDANVVEGQATVGMEILNQMQEIEKNTVLILTGVGGGGILAGTQAAINHYKTNTQLIGVEPENAASMTAALEEGKPVTTQTKHSIADGANVATVGHIGLKAASDNSIKIITSPEGRLCESLLEMYDQRVILEGAGSLGVDGLKSLSEGVLQTISDKNGSIVIILTGGNMDPSGYHDAIEKRDRYTGFKKDIVVTFPQRGLALAEFSSLLPQGANIIHMNYDEKGSASAAPGNFTMTFDTPEIFENFMKTMEDSVFKVKILKNKF